MSLLPLNFRDLTDDQTENLTKYLASLMVDIVLETAPTRARQLIDDLKARGVVLTLEFNPTGISVTYKFDVSLELLVACLGRIEREAMAS